MLAQTLGDWAYLGGLEGPSNPKSCLTLDMHRILSMTICLIVLTIVRMCIA